MKGAFLSLLDPLGRMSLLNLRHRLNPFRSLVVERRPPGVIPERGHASLLSKFYGDAATLDLVPAPNMEWWWQAIEAKSKSGTDYSIITNVQVFGIPLAGWVAQGTVAVRRLDNGKFWEAHTTGVVDPGDNAHFTASSWRLGLQDDRYLVGVSTSELSLDLDIELGQTAFLGDPGGKSGWYDLNPDGFVPMWASYRSRFAKRLQKGTLVLPGQAAEELEHVVSRFDHQSLHFSPRDVGAFSLPVLAEGLVLRPQWLWYHARIAYGNHQANLMLCKVLNGHTGRLMKLAAALSDDDGHTALVDPKSITLEDAAEGGVRGRVEAPRALNASFAVPKAGGLEAWAGAYRLCLSADGEEDWTVKYPIVGPLRYEAQELPVTVAGHFVSAETAQRVPVTGSGTQEVLDMLKSVTLKT